MNYGVRGARIKVDCWRWSKLRGYELLLFSSVRRVELIEWRLRVLRGVTRLQYLRRSLRAESVFVRGVPDWSVFAFNNNESAKNRLLARRREI